MLIWIDGALVPAEEARLGVLTHALHYGTAVLDGCRFYRLDDGRVALFRLADHLARLARGAGALGASLGHGQAELTEASRAVARSFAERAPEGYLRQIAFLGEGRMGIGADNALRVAVAAWSLAPRPAAPIALRVAGFGHGPSWLPGVKLAGHYARAFLARREAQASGFDDAVFLAADGAVAEATGANLFAVIGGRLVTPPAWAPILPGITRDTVIALAADAGVPVDERPLRRDELLAADEVFLCGSSAEIQPVGRFEARAFPAPGPVTAGIAARYARAARGGPGARPGWLEVIP